MYCRLYLDEWPDLSDESKPFSLFLLIELILLGFWFCIREFSFLLIEVNDLIYCDSSFFLFMKFIYMLYKLVFENS